MSHPRGTTQARQPRAILAVAAAAAALGVVACTGVLAGSDGVVDGAPVGGPRDVLGKTLEVDAAPLPARAWRLNRKDYRTTVAHLLDLPPDYTWLAHPADIDAHASNVLLVSEQLAAHYFDQAEAIAGALPAARLAALGACQELDASCADTFLPRLLKKAFRRPVSEADIARYREVYDAASTAEDPTFPFRAVLTAVLVSPHFLYRTEMGPTEGTPESTFSITDHELASLLSYGILGLPPSPELLAAADEGVLSEPAQLELWVSELLERPEATERLRAFLASWLHVEHFPALVKDPAVFAGFDGDIAELMYREASLFLEQVGNLDERASNLLTAPVPSTDPRLEAFYAGPTGSSHHESRLGALSLGGVLSEHGRANLGSPVLRGLFIREQILCGHIPPPPASVNTQLELPGSDSEPGSSAALTTRQVFERHLSTPDCQGCHKYIDPLGYAFEHFDGAGRYRFEENGVSVDTTVDVYGTTDLDGPTTGHEDLTANMAESADYLTCLALQGFGNYLGYSGRLRSTNDPVPLGVAEAGAALAASDGVMRELVRALFTSKTLLQRQRD